MSNLRRYLTAASAISLMIGASSTAFAQDVLVRPTITVTDFEFGTVAAQIAGDKGTRKRLEKMGIRDHKGFAAMLGVGAADIIVEKLLASGAYRVLERKQLTAIVQEQRLSADSAASIAAAVPGAAAMVASTAPAKVTRARYIVTGSVTRLGFEEKHLGGIAGRLAGATVLYGLGAKKQTTEVHLTARVVDSETGEIVASFTGQGLSDRGWGLTMFGLGGWGLGGLKAGSEGIRETAIGEATAFAAQNIVERIGLARATMTATTR